jgi:hypothetical protein
MFARVTIMYAEMQYYYKRPTPGSEVGIDTDKSVECLTPTNTRPLIERSERSYFFEKPKAKIVPSTSIFVDR